MSSAIRHRGVKVVVDTTETAEFDIQGFQIPDVAIEVAAESLRQMPYSPSD